MGRSRDFLERFRPSGTPGAAARPGVPADRVAERAAELEPLLARLADTEAEVEQITVAARQAADLRRREGQDRVRATLAAGSQQVQADRAEAAARVRRQAEVETAAVLTAAEVEADAVRSRAQQRLPELVRRVVATVRADLAAVGTASAEPP